MGDKTSIEWTDATWNPIIGCSRVGPGCDHCYAIGVVHREMSPQHVGLTVKPEGGPTDWTGEVRPAGEHKLTEPLRWTKPRRIFVNSLSDLFHPDLPDDEIAKVFAVMALAPQHTFQVLTKRPHRMAKLLAAEQFGAMVGSEILARSPSKEATDAAWRWPLPNVHVGVSIENDSYTWRADHLRETPAAVRFISAEPLLGPLPSLDLTRIDWLIVGGESGPGARPMHPDWVRDLRDRSRVGCVCGYRHSGPAFLFKQWGDWVYGEDAAQASLGDDGFANAAPWVGSGRLCYWDDGLDPSYRVGKKAAGRHLDGRTWDEYPNKETTDA
jgi:protein gp37